MIAGFFRWLGRLWNRILVYIIAIYTVVSPVIAEAWNQGGRILRFALFIVLLFPLFISLVALIGSSWFTATVGIIISVGILCVILSMVNPIIFGLIAAIPGGRTFLRRVIEVLAIELVFCVYFSVIPVDSIRSMIPVVILLMFAITLLSLAGTRLARIFRFVMSVLLVGVTVLFIFSYLRPETYASLWTWNERADKKSAKAVLDTTTTVVTNPATTQRIAQSSKTEYKQFHTYDLPKGSWTAMIEATLYPNYDVRVTDSTKIRFSDGYEDLITEKGGHGFGAHVGKFQLLALGSNTRASVGEY